ncbi:GNAT family N-acetyltransferase [Microbulbifer epialgicus]|uniref:GNAT family N-acetyltransferase n=1 Tax=Microbulbifer epialgicus TaxID=393907 RepID=A0ABV4P829_9GAMM
MEFIDLSHVKIGELLTILNEQKIRKHLIEHAYFDVASLRQWVENKIKIDLLPGCRIRAVYINGILAGWCGIQPDDKGFELAIVISQKFWGSGTLVFKELMRWAKELGHKEVLLHLLESRPEYRILKRVATQVHKTELLGRSFTTYYIGVGSDAYYDV